MTGFLIFAVVIAAAVLAVASVDDAPDQDRDGPP
jgi:hypothetical protein